MEYKNTLEIIIQDIKDIENSMWELKKMDNPPLLEIDRALLKLINLYDLLSLIKNDLKNNHHKTSPDHEDLSNEKATKPTSSPDVKDSSKKEVDIPKGDESLGDRKQGSDASENVEIKRERKDPGVIGEKFSGSRKFMNESLQHNHRKNISSVLQNKPLVNIESAIGINDKFLFVRDLFNGDTRLFHNTLERLNKAHDFNDAFSFINDQFEWDMDSYPAQKLLELVRRKFIINKNG